MIKMDIKLFALVECHGTVTVRATALAPAVGAKNWIRVEFERSGQEPWAEARDRVLALLDMK